MYPACNHQFPGALAPSEGNEHKKNMVRMHEREIDIRKKNNGTESLCRDERDCSVNDISNVRCHGWNVGKSKE